MVLSLKHPPPAPRLARANVMHCRFQALSAGSHHCRCPGPRACGRGPMRCNGRLLSRHRLKTSASAAPGTSRCFVPLFPVRHSLHFPLFSVRHWSTAAQGCIDTNDGRRLQVLSAESLPRRLPRRGAPLPPPPPAVAAIDLTDDRVVAALQAEAACIQAAHRAVQAASAQQQVPPAATRGPGQLL